MTATWLAEDRASAATARILDAAGRLFAANGVQGTDMVDIARLAGCSRATVYRYFENRQALHRAFIEREAVRIAREAAAGVADVDDPGDRLVAAVLACLRAVRTDPALAAWFGPADQGLTGRLAASTPLIETLARVFIGDEDAPTPEARWLVRIIVSLLAVPGEDEAAERAMLERFVVPVIT